MAMTNESVLQSAARINGHCDRNVEPVTSLKAVWSSHDECPVAELAAWRAELLELLRLGPQLNEDVRHQSAQRYFDTLEMLGSDQNPWQKAVRLLTVTLIVRGTRANFDLGGLTGIEAGTPYVKQLAESLDRLAETSQQEPVDRIRLLWLLGIAAAHDRNVGAERGIASHCDRVQSCISAFLDFADGRSPVLGDGPLETLLRERLSYHTEPARGTSVSPATYRTRLCRFWCGRDYWTTGGTLRIAAITLFSLIALVALDYGISSWQRIERFRNEDVKPFQVNSTWSQVGK